MMSTSSRSEFTAQVLVVGAGVAGCAAARELIERGTSVILLHGCADTWGTEAVSNQCCKYLPEKLLSIGSQITEIVAWWGSRARVSISAEGARIVQREVLARDFRSHVSELGCRLFGIKKMLRLRRTNEQWEAIVQTSKGDAMRFKARFLVEATGRVAAVARLLGAHRVSEDYLCSASWAVEAARGVWTEAAPNGWWNLCSDGKGGTLSFYSNGEIVRSVRENVSTKFKETHELRRSVSLPEGSKAVVRVCGSSLLCPCAGKGWISVGDAALTLQPLASSGIMVALRDGKNVMSALNQDPAEYNLARQKEFLRYLKELRNQYRLEGRWSKEVFWHSMSC
jgi:flavin-dependent dehydrogenase